MKLDLRWYQQGAFDALFEYLRESDGNPCIELPTGAGKTPLIVAIIHYVQTNWPGTKIMVLAHTQELVEQGYDKLLQFWPEANAGIYSAGLNRYDTEQPVIFAGIQSVATKAKLFGAPELIVIDEAHRIPVKGDGQYRTFIAAAQKLCPDARVIGLTATPYRLAGGAVCGKKKILHEIIYRAPVGRLIDEGYLCRPVVPVVDHKPKVRGVVPKNDQGEYDQKEQEAVVTAEALIRATVTEIVQRAALRKKWLLFGVSKKHLEMLRTEFMMQGLDIPILHDGVPKKLRGKLIKEFKAGKYRGMLNINILTEGFDDPTVDCIVMLASTMSPGKYYQQVGRGFRIFPGKSDFLVLDFADNVVEHGPVDDIRPPSEGGGGEAPVKICMQCRNYVAAGVRECPHCGHEFPPAERDDMPKHHVAPTSAPVLLADAARWVRVAGWTLSPHQKPGSRTTLRVDYNIGPQRMSEWLCFDHGGPPRVDAVQWWTDRGGARPAPKSVANAIERRGELQCPVEINVVFAGRYPRIMGYRYVAP